MNKSNLCYGCNKRYVGCHSECANYQEFKKKRNEAVQYIKQGRELDGYYIETSHKLTKMGY